MKAAIVLCLIAVACAQKVELTDKQKEIANKLIAECLKESGVDSSAVQAFRNGEWKEDEKLNEFFYCFFKKAGIVDEQGKIVVETALAKLPPGADKESARQVMNQCISQSGSTPAETTTKILKCYKDNAKQNIQLLF